MTTITVLAIIDFEARPKAPLTRMMNERLEGFAADLQAFLDKELQDVKDMEDLVIYLSYNSNYTIRWMIVNDVPAAITSLVSNKCAKLGYIAWKGVDLYKFK
ncbi:hypothetical protein [Pedobacter heparinus]|uniref:hypothetical protein n=1 Tax=Pedobacter heparinus TaxID=984 RepID=UPI0029305B40|nr:hypothetical protein [Pedobacter heparinus]